MKLIKIAAAALTAVFIAALAIACAQNAATGDNSTGDNQSGVVVAEKDYIPSNTDNISVGEKPKDYWWSNWVRYTCNDSPDGADAVYADAATVGAGIYDDGSSPYFRATRETALKNTVNAFNTLGIKKQAWIEGFGDSRNIIMAVKKKSDGTYEMDDIIGAPRLAAHYWSWDQMGPSKVKDLTIVWGGLPGYVNKAPWMGQYVIDENEVPLPTYPDGTPALGYFDGKDSPNRSKLYDACGSKDLNGNFMQYAELYDTPKDGNINVKLEDGTEINIGDYSVGKDEAAPFWLDYTRSAVRYFLKLGVDGFWVDNYIGWDSLSGTPNNKGFGEWTKAGVREFIKQHPELGVTVDDNWDITKYLKNKLKEWYPDSDPDDISWANPYWRDSQWITDPVWRAYLTYKSNSIYSASKKLYEIVKEEAKKLGLDPNEIAVTGNDFCLMHNAAVDGTTLDLVSTEYGPDYQVIAGTNYDGLPPKGRATGIFSILGQCAVGKYPTVWYYAKQTPKSVITGLAVGYHALSHNVTINSGEGLSNGVGTNKSARLVNKSIKILRDYFGDRDKYAEVGVMFSANSEYSYLAPGGYTMGEDNPATVGYLGWCHTLDELHIPFRAIYEFNLEKMINEVNVLIMPGVRSIRKDTIDKVLKPFLDNGGTIIVTGPEAGAMDTKEGLFQPYGSNLLEDLAKNYSGKGKVVYLPEDPAIEVYTMHQKVDTLAELYEIAKPVSDLFDGLYKENRLNKSLEVSGFGDYVYFTTNYDPYQPAFFVDIVNMNIDVQADSVPKTSGKVKVRVPKALTGKKLEVLFYNSDVAGTDQEPVKPLTGVKVSGGYLELDIPEFGVYTTVIIRPAK